MSHLHTYGLSFSYAGHRVLTNIFFVISSREQVSLIGENGSGKPTLLKLIGLLHHSHPSVQKKTVNQALERAAPARKTARSITELGNAMAKEPDEPKIADAYAEALEEVCVPA